MNNDEKTTPAGDFDTDTQDTQTQACSRKKGIKTEMDVGPVEEMKGGVMMPVSFRKPYELGYITSVTPTQIRYTRDFYIQMYRLGKEGKTAAEAYASLGFDIDITGKERAQQAMSKAMQKGKSGELLRRSPGDYRGDIELTDDLFQTLDAMDPEEEIAQLKAMMIYNQELVQAQKKTLTAFRATTTH